MWRSKVLWFAYRKPWNVLEENCALLGCYAACSGKSLFWPLKMEPTGCPETSVRINHYKLRNSPEERRSHLQRSRSLKSCTKYRVIHKSLREFRPLRNSSQDGHTEREHVNRGRDTPSFCPTLQVLDMSTLGDAADVNPVIKFRQHTCKV